MEICMHIPLHRQSRQAEMSLLACKIFNSYMTVLLVLLTLPIYASTTNIQSAKCARSVHSGGFTLRVIHLRSAHLPGISLIRMLVDINTATAFNQRYLTYEVTLVDDNPGIKMWNVVGFVSKLTNLLSSYSALQPAHFAAHHDHWWPSSSHCWWTSWISQTSASYEYAWLQPRSLPERFFNQQPFSEWVTLALNLQVVCPKVPADSRLNDISPACTLQRKY